MSGRAPRARVAFIQPRLAGFGGFEKYGVHVIQLISESMPLDVYSEHDVDLSEVQRAFGVRLDRARFVNDPRCNPQVSTKSVGRWQAMQERRTALTQYEAVTRPYDLVIGQTVSLPWHCAARRSVLLCHFPVVRGLRIRRDTPSSGLASLLSAAGREQREIRSRINSWSQVVANSEFTRHWVREYWDREAQVINPPIELPVRPELSAKQPWILGTGFFSPPEPTSGDAWSYKRQEVLIDSFKALHDGGLRGWELHLAGHMLETPAVRSFFAGLQARAAGYPVHFHPNCPHAELLDLFRRSTVFWHATGYGISEEEHPERMEHFGMATVEAMGWGCVPVVVRKGGQPEIVETGRSGFLWDTLEEMQAATRYLASDARMCGELAASAIARAQSFGLERFRRQFGSLVEAELSRLS